MDVLSSDGLTVSNVKATYDSVFLNNAFPGAIRFPASGYSNITFENVTLRDLADAPANGPFGNATAPSNNGIVFRNVQVILNRWANPKMPTPTIGGVNNDVSIEYVISTQQKKSTYRLQGGQWNSG